MMSLLLLSPEKKLLGHLSVRNVLFTIGMIKAAMNKSVFSLIKHLLWPKLKQCLLKQAQRQISLLMTLKYNLLPLSKQQPYPASKMWLNAQ